MKPNGLLISSCRSKKIGFWNCKPKQKRLKLKLSSNMMNSLGLQIRVKNSTSSISKP